MKNSTVLAAAFAAGMMAFAANAQEEGNGQAATSQIPGVGIWTQEMASLSSDVAQTARGLTTEEVFHAAKAVEKDRKTASDDDGEQKDKEKQEVAGPEERYKPFIEKYAFENGVPIELAHAVITIESNYKPYSLGRAGEVGLMQIKPATARMMGYKGSTTGLFDPETNIKFGMKYLGKARKLGGGTTCGTILKYNAGHAAKRMNATSRDYCKKVKRHLAGTVSAGLSDEAGKERGA